MFVELAVNLPAIRGTFHYHVPPELAGQVALGHLVIAPFGTRRSQGIVVGLPDQPEVPETRPIESLVDPEPVLTPAQIDLARWLSREYRAPLIDGLALMLPPGLGQQADVRYSVLDSEAAPGSPAEERVLRLLRSRGPLRGRQLGRALPHSDWRRSADAMVRRGLLSRVSVLEPPRVHPKHIHTARVAVGVEQARAAVARLAGLSSKAARRRRAALETLLAEPGPLEVTWIYAEAGATRADLNWLEQEGLVELGEREVWRDPLAEVDYVPANPPTLTRDQAACWESIRQSLADRTAPPILLQGVTGSGKTEIYLRAVAQTLQMGQRALVLVPEIALTPQTVQRFLARFPGRVGVLHSQLGLGPRFDTWRRCRAGLLDVVVGPRSALFSPLPDLGLIVLDEAHDDSYKEQGQSPRYDARHAALTYARRLNALCILGSATPDVVTMHRALHGELQLLRLPKRILGHRIRIQQQAERLGLSPLYRSEGGELQVIDLPPVGVVDMRLELKAGNRSLFSRELQRALTETIQAGHQAILFLNRRGTASYIFCRDCGHVLRCPRCENPLTFHGVRQELLCHHCGLHRQPPARCPNCGGDRVRHFGAGTQRIQTEVEALLPGVRTLRWDWDATRAAGSHDVLLAHFAAHRADILVGTQMIAKGLDLPLVTLVGVVSADTGLNLPDFRAGERTFQVLTQVAGRAGRGLLGGRVLLQTYQPDHYAIRAAARHDYGSFYMQEMELRRALDYPPFHRLCRLVHRSPSEKRSQREAERLAAGLREEIRKSGQRASLIGPAPCFHRRLRGLFRWQIVIRGSDPGALVPDPLPEGWSVDVDPVSLL